MGIFENILMLQLVILLLLLGETFRRVKVTNSSFSDDNFARRLVSPNTVLPDKVSKIQVLSSEKGVPL